jgi:arylsulfatase A-like enzyme
MEPVEGALKEPKASGERPNVLVVLIDDMGFGASSAFGGPCRMPTADRMASQGLRFSQFHVTAMCSPTRAALLTGRNHHSVGMGSISETATDAPGYSGSRPESAATVAQILRSNGYATAAFGKMHQTPPWEVGPTGPFDRWPNGDGFEEFYGFLGAETNQFSPTLIHNTTAVEPPATAGDGYHLSEDLVDRAIGWTAMVEAMTPDRPWFCYLSFGATHSPFHVPSSWRDRYRGEFSHGWNEQREHTLERQKKLGVVPSDAELTDWPDGVPEWDELSEEQRVVAERLMEVYAAFAEHTDEQTGRLLDALAQRGGLDNTLVMYILGDNGASAEGGLQGTLNEMLYPNGLAGTAAHAITRLEEIGGPKTYAHYPVGWAIAMDTPYQYAKQVASHYGGTRVGMIVQWPERIKDAGKIRHQWHHCIDVVPTILEAAGVAPPDLFGGVAQVPIEGTSFLYAIDDAEASDRHVVQYFEMYCNRGIYQDGWTAATKHRVPWLEGQTDIPALDDDV